jgi:hypothetical protein
LLRANNFKSSPHFSATNNKIKMNATKNHIGKNQVTGRKTTRRVTSTIGQVRSLASKPKTLNEIRKDKQKSVPIAMLPMVF